MTNYIWQDDDDKQTDRTIMEFMAGEDVVLDRELFVFDIQATAAHALGESFAELLDSVMSAYPRRRRIMVEALTGAGFEVFDAAATFYVWCRVPGDESSVDFCGRALEEIGVVITPGPGFGPGGEGWFRISLTASDEDVAEGARRIGAWR